MSPDWFLFILSMVILGGFVIFVVYLLASDKFAGRSYDPPRCPAGSCVTDLLTGVKTCPTNTTDTLIYDPSQSACNSQYLCDNPITPYALQSDGSTDLNGNCEPGVPCRCTTTAQCPSYIV